MRVHFVNENVGGHATMHRHVRRELDRHHPSVEPTFWDIPRDVLLARLVSASWPGLGRLDLDLHLVRARLAQSALVRRHLRRLEEPDVLHLYTQNTGWLSTGVMRRVPTVVSIDATNRQNAYRLPQRHPTRFTPLTVAAGHIWERRVFDTARAVVAHSRWAADAVRGYGIPADRVHVIPFGIDVPETLEPEPASGPPTVLFIGTSMDRKGGWRLLEIWRRSLSDISRLVLVTPERVPPVEGVVVHGDVRPGDGKLDRILASADVFAMPGEIDAFGYAILEAMAASLPVVASAQAAVPELVADGATGLLVPPGDDDAFAAALRRLLLDPDERAALGASGRIRVLERFDARVTTAALVEIILAVAG